MTRSATSGRRRSQRLTRERILRAAICIADRDGVDAVTMRGLGSELGVEGMALYRHFANKGELLESMVDLLIGEITIPPVGGPWRSAIRAQAFSARAILGHRRWAQRLLATRVVLGPGTLRHIEGVTRALRDAGFSHALAHHTMHVLGARIYGFTQEPFDDALTPEAVQRFVGLIRAGDYPAMQATAPQVRHDADKEFVFALDLLLDALERARRNEARTAPRAAASPSSPSAVSQTGGRNRLGKAALRK
jgi:AcrR family transcriptional regulator